MEILTPEQMNSILGRIRQHQKTEQVQNNNKTSTDTSNVGVENEALLTKKVLAKWMGYNESYVVQVLKGKKSEQATHEFSVAFKVALRALGYGQFLKQVEPVQVPAFAEQEVKIQYLAKEPNRPINQEEFEQLKWETKGALDQADFPQNPEDGLILREMFHNLKTIICLLNSKNSHANSSSG